MHQQLSASQSKVKEQNSRPPRDAQQQNNHPTPPLRNLKNKERKELLSQLAADSIDYRAALESLQSVRDQHVENVRVLLGTTQRYIEKTCQVCDSMDGEASMLLCDRCDDAYHLYCMNPPMKDIPDREWICPACTQDIRKETMVVKGESKPQQKHCFACKKEIAQKGPIEFWKGDDVDTMTKVEAPIKSGGGFTCKICNKMFHNDCLNERVNAVNCTACERKLRMELPRGLNNFIRFVEQSQRIDAHFRSNYELLPSPTEQTKHHQLNPMERIGLQLPDECDNPYVLIKSMASLSYALKTQRVCFFDQQIYPKAVTRPSMNHPPKHSFIRPLHHADQRTFEKFKKMSKQGFFGTLEIAESKTKGFYVKAICEVPAMTILCEYTGEVVSSRYSLSETTNDSIFSLLDTSHSKTSLDICPSRYGNLSKFMCGINNAHGKRKLNVQSLRFLYYGNVRVVLFAKRIIKAGETLYFDYNGGGVYEYPTEHFDVE